MINKRLKQVKDALVEAGGKKMTVDEAVSAGLEMASLPMDGYTFGVIRELGYEIEDAIEEGEDVSEDVFKYHSTVISLYKDERMKGI